MENQILRAKHVLAVSHCFFSSLTIFDFCWPILECHNHRCLLKSFIKCYFQPLGVLGTCFSTLGHIETLNKSLGK